ncbi:hypothetical protein ACQP00_36135 [Dactylosporangium sp. CS-047395]|uniref:hypothetical protein n=1 Tax=Dactylosporangium sp. CS-047395 TaxID=3239936 RepID=UPI003D916F15
MPPDPPADPVIARPPPGVPGGAVTTARRDPLIVELDEALQLRRVQRHERRTGRTLRVLVRIAGTLETGVSAVDLEPIPDLPPSPGYGGVAVLDDGSIAAIFDRDAGSGAAQAQDANR